MSIKNMRTRINYAGGSNQIARMNADKLKSLKKALLYSYQSATAKLEDGREFRCLINPNKLSLDIDNKILSIPFKDVCLNATSGVIPDFDSDDHQSEEGKWEEMGDLIAVLSYADEGWEDMVPEEDVEDVEIPTDDIVIDEGEQEIGIKEGSVFEWKENHSHWLVYLRRLEETAYFRADIRRCRYQLTLGNGSKYWVYVRGPVEQSAIWTQNKGNYFNKLNYTLILYVAQTEETLKYFGRFKKIDINGKPWEVQAVDTLSTPGIIEMTLKETYSNTIETNIEEAVKKAEEKEVVKEQDTALPYIYGTTTVYPYDVHTYTLKNHNGGGSWSVEGESRQNAVKLIVKSDLSVDIQILTGKSGRFYLVYKIDDVVVADLGITIESL
jgi:hypothetical protein